MGKNSKIHVNTPKGVCWFDYKSWLFEKNWKEQKIMKKEIKLRAIDVFRHTLSDHKALGKVSEAGMQKDAVEKIAGPAIEEAMIKFAIYHTSLAIAKIKEDLRLPLQDLHSVYYSDEFGGRRTGHQLFKEAYPLENIV